MRIYDSDMKRLLYGELGDDLRKKDGELEINYELLKLKDEEIELKYELLKLKDREIKLKEDKIKELENYNKEFKKGLIKLKAFENIMPDEFNLIVNQLLDLNND